MIKGIAVSDGIAIGKVFKLEQPTITIPEGFSNVDNEISKFNAAIDKTVSDIEVIKNNAKDSLSEEEVAIFDAHIMITNDPEIRNQVESSIKEGYNAAKATDITGKNTIAMFENMDDPYFKERAADMKDVFFRILCNLTNTAIPDLTTINAEVVVVAHDLTPSDTAQLNKKYVLGFATEIGGRTSHSAIMARSLEIPAVVGSNDILANCKHGDTIILDALKGNILINPSQEEINSYTKAKEEFTKETELLKKLINEKSVSNDGHEVEISGNIGTPNDVDGVLKNGGDGIGLYRTEFLYMDSKNDFPDEDTQFEAYKIVLESMNGKRVVVRTLDIGGDKKLNYFEFPQEMNPFLGYRAIRLCLDRKDIFKTQIRALLRASIYGNLCIMFPMIATINEFKQAKKFVLDTKEELIKEGKKVSDNIQIGMMVEIPSAAILASEFSKYADFFSIGTNDLIQYSMAADRMSESVSYLYQPLNPSILRLVKMTIDGAHANGKWCGMCGEMAGDVLAAPILLGFGLDEFSMSSSSILKTRKMIRNISYKEMQSLSQKALSLDTAEEVIELINKSLK